LFISAVLPLGATRCAHLAAEIPRAATPGVIEGGLEGLDDPVNKRRLAHILASPEMKVIQRELVADILDGSLAALGEPERVERVGVVTSRYAASLLHGFSRDVAPELSTATSTTMHGVMGVALSAENQRQMQRLVGSLVQASVEPIAKGLSDAELSSSMSGALTKELGPAIQNVLRDNLGPGLAEALSSDEVKRALGNTAHALGREMILGANEGLASVQEGKSSKSSDPSVLASFSSLAQQGVTAGRFFPWVAAAVAVLLGVWVWRLRGQTTRYRTEGEQRAETTRVLTEALGAAEGKPWSGELFTALEDRLRSDDDALLRIRAARLGRRRPSSTGTNGASRA
jgi:hypothetical protein